MTKGRSSPYYGQLQTKTLNPEVYRIWKTRDDELDELPFVFEDTAVSYANEIENRNYAQKLWATANCSPTEQVVLVQTIINGLTLQETGSELGVTPERVRQIQTRALKKLRDTSHAIRRDEEQQQLQYKINQGMKLWELLYCRGSLYRLTESTG
jgi:DNA-directed RNA polymerase specialized sigma24 family protein